MGAHLKARYKAWMVTDLAVIKINAGGDLPVALGDSRGAGPDGKPLDLIAPSP